MWNAAITIREFPEDWQAETPKKEIRPRTNRKSTPAYSVTGAMIKQARLRQGISQRQLSTLLHKSQSWIRDIELERYKIKPKDVQLLASVLVDLPHS
ncbi:helix-turn-helix transcriptional regulator [Gloeomargaritales cyanobacterium VI4D9]|nr:helix-turn-helix transcriptional regulator [Gloeomargaritales cyanobacterium VI4D9]